MTGKASRRDGNDFISGREIGDRITGPQNHSGAVSAYRCIEIHDTEGLQDIAEVQGRRMNAHFHFIRLEFSAYRRKVFESLDAAFCFQLDTAGRLVFCGRG